MLQMMMTKMTLYSKLGSQVSQAHSVQGLDVPHILGSSKAVDSCTCVPHS